MGAPRKTRRRPAYRAAGARCMGIGIALLLLAVLPAGASAALSSVANNDWVTNGPVQAMARSGNTLYLGGSFSEIGPRTGPAVSFSGGSSTPDAGFPQVSGAHAEVRAAISDRAGGWYIGGNFTHVGGVARAGLAHVLLGGEVDPTFAPSLEVAHGWSVTALALSGGTLYVGGNFQSVSGEARHGLAAVNTSDGSLQSWNPAPTSGVVAVEALALSAGTLYVGGSFTEMGGEARSDLAAFTTSTNALTSWAPQVAGSGPSVKALAVSGSQVYLAGSFDHVGGQARSGFAAVETSGSLSSWNPEASGCASVGYALAVTGAVVYVGGCFTHIGGQARAGLAALDPTTAAATSWNPEADPSGSSVVSIAPSGTDVYVAGAFTQIGGQTRNGLAALEATTATATIWDPDPNATSGLSGFPFAGKVSLVATAGSQVLVGGSFTSVGGFARSDLAAVDLATGEATAWDPNVTPAFPLMTVPISAISIAGGSVYVGGSFSSVGGQSRTDLAALDPTTGNATSWNPGASSVFPENGHISALLATNSTIYVGGSFTTLAGRAQRYLGAVDPSSGTATSWSPVVSAPSAATAHGASPIGALALSGTTLYLGGDFSELGGQSHTALGAVSTESAVATAWSPALTSFSEPLFVRGLALSGGTVYANDQVDPMAINASTGTVVNLNHAGGPIAVGTNSTVYIGGGGLDANSRLPLAWNPQPGTGASTVLAVLAYENQVYLGGSFSTTEATAASGFAAFTIYGPLNSAVPTITGVAAEGQTLTEHHGSWTGSPTAYSYQWLRCVSNSFTPWLCIPISGATGPSYTPTFSDVGAMLEVQETATNPESTSDPVSSVATVSIVALPANTSQPTVTGTVSVGQTLNCSTGSWTNNPTGYTYAWLRDSAPILGATSASYVVSTSDAGHNLACQVTATNAAGPAMTTSASVSVPAPEESKPAGGSGGGSGGSTGGGSSEGGGPPPSITPVLTAPPPAAPAVAAQSATKCVVPNLKHKRLAAAKKLLARAHCKLGKVTKPKKHTTRKLKVIRQKPGAKKTVAAGTKVSVRLG